MRTATEMPRRDGDRRAVLTDIDAMESGRQSPETLATAKILHPALEQPKQ